MVATAPKGGWNSRRMQGFFEATSFVDGTRNKIRRCVIDFNLAGIWYIKVDNFWCARFWCQKIAEMMTLRFHDRIEDLPVGCYVKNV